MSQDEIKQKVEINKWTVIIENVSHISAKISSEICEIAGIEITLDFFSNLNS